jgi:hypothetical protein
MAGGKIDPATGRRTRDKVIFGKARDKAPKRSNGKIVRGGRLAHQRSRTTGWS